MDRSPEFSARYAVRLEVLAGGDTPARTAGNSDAINLANMRNIRNVCYSVRTSDRVLRGN